MTTSGNLSEAWRKLADLLQEPSETGERIIDPGLGDVVRRSLEGDSAGEFERYIATRLRTSPEAIALAARLLYGISATEERDKRARPGMPKHRESREIVQEPSSDRTWYCAGTYSQILSFDLDGEIISPQAPPGLEPGDPWPGPRVGMSYTLAAGGEDIYLKFESAPQRVKQDYLSDHCGEDKARFLAERLAEVKGREGGRIYINEARESFAPKGDVPTPPYLYLGPLDDESWFPAPRTS